MRLCGVYTRSLLVCVFKSTCGMCACVSTENRVNDTNRGGIRSAQSGPIGGDLSRV